MKTLIERLDAVMALFPDIEYKDLYEALTRHQEPTNGEGGQTSDRCFPQETVERIVNDLKGILESVRIEENQSHQLVITGCYSIWPHVDLHFRLRFSNEYPSQPPEYYIENIDKFFPDLNPAVKLDVADARNLKLVAQIKTICGHLLQSKPWFEVFPQILADCKRDLALELVQDDNFRVTTADNPKEKLIIGNKKVIDHLLGFEIRLPTKFPIAEPEIRVTDLQGISFKADSNQPLPYQSELESPWERNRDVRRVIRAAVTFVISHSSIEDPAVRTWYESDPDRLSRESEVVNAILEDVKPNFSTSRALVISGLFRMRGVDAVLRLSLEYPDDFPKTAPRVRWLDGETEETIDSAPIRSDGTLAIPDGDWQPGYKGDFMLKRGLDFIQAYCDFQTVSDPADMEGEQCQTWFDRDPDRLSLEITALNTFLEDTECRTSDDSDLFFIGRVQPFGAEFSLRLALRFPIDFPESAPDVYWVDENDRPLMFHFLPTKSDGALKLPEDEWQPGSSALQLVKTAITFIQNNCDLQPSPG
jgi:ubiquitin-protein ligase